MGLVRRSKRRMARSLWRGCTLLCLGVILGLLAACETSLNGPRPPLPAERQALQIVHPTAVPADESSVGELPIFDTHMHYSQDAWERFPPDRIIAKLEAVTVTHALVSSTPDEGTRRLYALDPARIVPSLRPYHANVTSSNWTDFAEIIPYFEERLATLDYAGIGEFHLHTVSVNSPVFQQTAQLAAEHGIYLHIHADAATIRAVFALVPDARVLWAHAGLTESPQTVSGVLDEYPNVWVDISIREYQIAPDGLLEPAWETLFLRHPDRITVGSDTWIPPRWESYEQIITQDRTWLAQLPREVAEQIAYRNAERLFGAIQRPAE